MNDPVWQLDLTKCSGSWQSNRLSTRIALDQPQAGWLDIRLGDSALPISPGKIKLGNGHDFSPLPPSSMHVRGRDLIATYPACEERCFTTQIYRRATTIQVENEAVPTLSTLISLNTHLLDAHPALLSTTSCDVDCEMLLAGESDFQVTDWTGDIEPQCSAVLVRPADAHWSYVELWHSIDFRSFQQMASGWQISFEEPLEKGVIRRLLLWGAVLPRANDLSLARSIRQVFLETAPPLAT